MVVYRLLWRHRGPDQAICGFVLPTTRLCIRRRRTNVKNKMSFEESSGVKKRYGMQI